MTEEPKPKPRRQGCLFYGCLIGAVCLASIVLALLLGVYQLRNMIFQFTETQPMTLPTVPMSSAEMDRVQQRFENFMDAVRGGRRTPPLTLTGDEVNALLATNPDFRALKGKVYVTIEGDRLKAQMSLPLADLGFSFFFKGRYLNGTGTFALSFQNGALRLSPDLVVVKGKPLPGVYLDKIRRQNFAQNLNSNPRASIALDKLQSIQVKDGKLIVVPKEEQ